MQGPRISKPLKTAGAWWALRRLIDTSVGQE